MHAEAPFKSIRLGGDIDLLLTDRTRARDRARRQMGQRELSAREDLRANRHVQLATYAYLRARAQTAGRIRRYFIVESGHILAQDASVFPDAVVCTAGERRIGRRSVESDRRRRYDWRWRQLDAGRIEVERRATQSAPMRRFRRPARSTAADDPDRFDDFVNLTGWADYE